jgi:phage shock protein A
MKMLGSLLFAAFTIVVVLLVLMFFLNRRAARHTVAAGSAQLGKLGNWFWNQDPKANYQKIVDDAAEEIRHATESIEENKALVNSLTTQVSSNRTEANRLQARLDNSLADDPEDKSGKAAEYMEKLELAKTHTKTNEGQLNRANALYQTNLKKIQFARQKIKDAQDRGRELGLNLEMAKTDAQISKLASTVSTGVSLDGLGEVEAEMQKQIDRYNAVGQVQSDLGLDGLKEVEEEERLRKADSRVKLEQYKKSKGIGQVV